MKIDTSEYDVVVYIQCPHCKHGWYAKPLSLEIEPFTKDGVVMDDVIGPLGNQYVKSYIVQGWDKMDLTKETVCLNCGNHYTPITMFGEGATENCMLMDEWVAKCLINCKGC